MPAGMSDADKAAFQETISALAGTAVGLASGNNNNATLGNGINSNLTEFNYLTHAEAELKQELSDKYWACKENPDCSDEQAEVYQKRIATLHKLDQDRNRQLEMACQYEPASDACRREIRKVEIAFESYKGQSNVTASGIASEYIEAATLFGEYRSEAYAVNARGALAEIPIDSVTGAIDIGVVVAGAALGDEDSKAQLAAIMYGTWQFLKDPANTISNGIKSQMAEADRLEAAGDINGAEKLRSKIILEFQLGAASTVMGGGAWTLTKLERWLPDKDLINTPHNPKPDLDSPDDVHQPSSNTPPTAPPHKPAQESNGHNTGGDQLTDPTDPNYVNPDQSGDLPNNMVVNNGGSSSDEKPNVIIDDKIQQQMGDRGWTPQGIHEIIAQGPSGSSYDNRRPNKTRDELGRNDTATVYGSPGSYIIINDRTGEVVQVSGRNDPDWIDDGRIEWK